MLKIKLLPRGKKHQITYRVVVAQDRSKNSGNFIDDLGFYTPQTKTISIDQDKMAQWQKNGAQITIGVDKLLNPDKYPKKIKNKKEDKAEKTEKSEEPIEEANQAPEETPQEQEEVKSE